MFREVIFKIANFFQYTNRSNFVIFLFLFFKSLDCYGQDSKLLIINEGFKNISPNLYCSTFPRINSMPEGSEENINFYDIKNNTMQWELNDRPFFDGGFTSGVIWCYVPLNNISEKYYRWFLVINNNRLNYVNFYWVDLKSPDIPSQQSLSGDYRQISEEFSTGMTPITSFPTFSLILPPGKEGIVYFGIDSDSVTRFQAMLYNSEKYGAMVSSRYFWQWVYALFALIVIVLQIIMTRTSFGITEIYYALAMISGLLYLGLFFGDVSYWLAITSGYIKNNLLFAFNLSYQFFVLCFLKGYLRTPEYSPWLCRLYTVQSIIVIFIGFLIFFVLDVNAIRVKLAAFSSILTAVSVFLGIVMAVYFRLNWAWGLAFSWLTVAISAIAMALVFLEIITYSHAIGHMLLWMFPLDVLTLSVSFFFRHKRLKKELNQLQSFINTLNKKNKENVLLQAKCKKENGDQLSEQIKCDTSGKRLKGINSQAKLNQLIEYLESSKAFLQEGMTLGKVANQVGLRADQLSAIVNYELSISFVTLMNEYRVREAKRLLCENPEDNLLSIAIASGFNSRTHFNRVFKLHTMAMPAQYRRAYGVT